MTRCTAAPVLAVSRNLRSVFPVAHELSNSRIAWSVVEPTDLHILTWSNGVIWSFPLPRQVKWLLRSSFRSWCQWYALSRRQQLLVTVTHWNGTSCWNDVRNDSVSSRYPSAWIPGQKSNRTSAWTCADTRISSRDHQRFMSSMPFCSHVTSSDAFHIYWLGEGSTLINVSFQWTNILKSSEIILNLFILIRSI